jgi:hypothetical protein
MTRKRCISPKNIFLAVVTSFRLIALIVLLLQYVLIGAGRTRTEFFFSFVWLRHLSFKDRRHEHLNSHKFFDLLGGSRLTSIRASHLISGGIIVKHHLR